MSNTVLSNTVPLIPQNKKKYFILQKDSWNYSINILFDHVGTINTVNLFLIVKSYFEDPSILVTSCYIVVKDLNNPGTKVLRTLSIKKLQKMHFIDFEIFIEELLDNDEMYLNSFQCYGIKMVFHPLSDYWEQEKIYPQYPWKKKFIDKFIKGKKDASEVSKLKKKIFFLNKVLRYRVYGGRLDFIWKNISKKWPKR